VGWERKPRARSGLGRGRRGDVNGRDHPRGQILDRSQMGTIGSHPVGYSLRCSSYRFWRSQFGFAAAV